MNQEIRTEVQSHLKRFAGAIDVLGRRLILKKLTESAEPWQTIIDFQNENNLQFKRCDSVLQFLDVLKCSKLTINESIFDTIKRMLNVELQTLTEQQLLALLPITINFISVNNLKSVPMNIIKRLNKVPDKYLQYLIKTNFITELPLNVRRQASESNKTYFLESISSHCNDTIVIMKKYVDRLVY